MPCPFVDVEPGRCSSASSSAWWSGRGCPPWSGARWSRPAGGSSTRRRRPAAAWRARRPAVRRGTTGLGHGRGDRRRARPPGAGCGRRGGRGRGGGRGDHGFRHGAPGADARVRDRGDAAERTHREHGDGRRGARAVERARARRSRRRRRAAGPPLDSSSSSRWNASLSRLCAPVTAGPPPRRPDDGDLPGPASSRRSRRTRRLPERIGDRVVLPARVPPDLQVAETQVAIERHEADETVAHDLLRPRAAGPRWCPPRPPRRRRSP